MDIFGNFAAERNGVIHCTCGWTYVPSDVEDSRNHAAHHTEFERVTKARGHVPWPYSVRERMKDVGRDSLRAAVTDADVLGAAELLVRAWFDRSFARSIELGYGDLHPSLAEYTRMLAEDLQLDARANEVLRSAYRHVQRPAGMIDATLWNPPPTQLVAINEVN